MRTKYEGLTQQQESVEDEPAHEHGGDEGGETVHRHDTAVNSTENNKNNEDPTSTTGNSSTTNTSRANRKRTNSGDSSLGRNDHSMQKGR